MNTSIKNSILLFTFIISFLMHFKHFNKDLMSFHVWRQTQTQSTIINFYEEDMNIFQPRRNDRGDTEGIFRMEFPLMQWLVACLYKVFGNHLVITRGFMFFIGLLSILGIYKLLYALFHNNILSIIGAWTITFSPSFYYYTINPLPDNVALCCSIWGLTLFFIWYKNQKTVYMILCGLMLSIGALSKLPFIVYYIVPFLCFLRNFFKKERQTKILIHTIGILSFSILPIIWYISVIPHWHGNIVIKGMLGNETTLFQILDYLHHNMISTLPELLLNYGSLLFFVAGFYFLFKRKAYLDPRFSFLLALSIAVLAYFFFELNAIAKVHDYYLFPFYPLLFILVAYGAYNLLIARKIVFKFITIILLILLPLFCYLRMKVRWNPDSPGFNKNLLIYKTELRNATPKHSLVVAGNDKSHFIFFYYIDKKGWAFQNNNLTQQALKNMIDKGAEYLYSDSREIDTNDELSQYIDTLILEKGNIKVFGLKNLP